MNFGDTLTLKSGVEATFMGMDEESGWILADVPGIGITALQPVDIEDGYDDRDH